MTHSTEVSWQLDGIDMFGTLVRPDGDGPYPAVVLVAGSGPTDRDWNSPMLPGSNGSAALLAEVLADAGIASLRYDKRASGPHVAENLPAISGRMSMQTHLEELVEATGVLAAQDGVDATRIVGLGNSEGCLHVLHYANTDQSIPFVGIVLASPPGRSIGAVLLTQLRAQLAAVPEGDALFALVEEAAARYSAGLPMDPDLRLPEPLRMVLASFETPANLPFARELWSKDAAPELAVVRVPTLVLIGRQDVQVDARLDGEPLQTSAAGNSEVVFAFLEHANHVMKEELRTPEQRAAAPAAGYNEPGTRLDPDAVQTILGWLHAVVT